MDILIVEDEPIALRRLKKVLGEVSAECRVVGETGSVKSTVGWFAGHPAPDLALMDIELTDGQSFGIFEQVKVPCPVIFITAYDEYAIKAFKLHSVDYLLKPVDAEDLRRSFAKLEEMKKVLAGLAREESALEGFLRSLKSELVGPRFRERFLIKAGQRFISIETSSILFFQAEAKNVFAYCSDGRSYPMDHTLEELEAMLDPKQFFRAGRPHLISRQSIREIRVESHGKLGLILHSPSAKPVIVSRERVLGFKEWMGY